MDAQLLIGTSTAVIAMLFTLSAGNKVRELITPVRRISLFALIPGRSPRVKFLITLTFLVLEISIAIGLAVFSRAAQVTALVTIAAYTLYMTSRRRVLDRSCHCFGGVLEFGGSIPALVVRNALLIVLCVMILAVAPLPSQALTPSHLMVASFAILTVLLLEKIHSQSAFLRAPLR